MKIFWYIIDIFNYMAHLEGQRYHVGKYEPYKSPKWLKENINEYD
jgi:hypothetical protein